MKNNLIKVILLILIVITMFSNCTVYASRADELEDPTANPDIWNPSIDLDGNPTLGEETELLEKAGIVLGFINVIGVVSSVIAISLIGVKYMMGSVEEKAEYKQALIPYVIGAVLVFAATTLPNVIFNVTKGLF